jgi:predicted transcriptional regulator
MCKRKSKTVSVVVDHVTKTFDFLSVAFMCCTLVHKIRYSLHILEFESKPSL